jgi:hypothetical protein
VAKSLLIWWAIHITNTGRCAELQGGNIRIFKINNVFGTANLPKLISDP